MKSPGRFNIRVYALLHNALREFLIAEEFHFNTFMRKFPGGGLDFGEGTKECLFRELREELNLEVNEATLFHVTDFFVASAFHTDNQVVAIYYLVEAPQHFIEQHRVHKELPTENGMEHFRWVKIEDLAQEDFTFPVDQQVARVIEQRLL